MTNEQQDKIEKEFERMSDKQVAENVCRWLGRYQLIEIVIDSIENGFATDEEIEEFYQEIKAQPTQQTYYERAKQDLDTLCTQYPQQVIPFAKWYMGEESYTFIENELYHDKLCAQIAQDVYDEAKQKGENHDDVFEISEKLNQFLNYAIPF